MKGRGRANGHTSRSRTFEKDGHDYDEAMQDEGAMMSHDRPHRRGHRRGRSGQKKKKGSHQEERKGKDEVKMLILPLDHPSQTHTIRAWRVRRDLVHNIKKPIDFDPMDHENYNAEKVRTRAQELTKTEQMFANKQKYDKCQT